MFEVFKKKKQINLTSKCDCKTIQESHIVNGDLYSDKEIKDYLNKRLAIDFENIFVNVDTTAACPSITVYENDKSFYSVYWGFDRYKRVCLTCGKCVSSLHTDFYDNLKAEIEKEYRQYKEKELVNKICKC